MRISRTQESGILRIITYEDVSVDTSLVRLVYHDDVVLPEEEVRLKLP